MTDSLFELHAAAIAAVFGEDLDAGLDALDEHGQTALQIGELTWDCEVGLLRAWPAADHGLLALITADRPRQQGEFRSAWPSTTSGVDHLVSVTAILPTFDHPFLNIIQGQVGGVALNMFDSRCATARGRIAVGMEAHAKLFACALQLQRVPTTEIVIPWEIASLDLQRDFADVFAREGELRLGIHEMTALVPSGHRDSSLYEVQGPIIAVRQGPSLITQTIHILDVVVAHDAEDRPITIEIWLNDSLWSGEPLLVGDRVRGLAWVQGNFE